MKKVAVILVNYLDYAEKFLADCRDGLRNQDFSEKFCVYIVDNASTPETVAYLSANFPEASVIPRPDGNYCAALNAGIKQGIADGCEYFVSLNLDTSLDKSWLRELVAAAENAPDCGIVQSKILLFPASEEEKKDPKINTLGNLIQFLGFGFTTAYKEASSAHSSTETAELPGYASGCSVLMKKDMLDTIGLFDEEYHMYHDDLEMSWRARLAGYKILIAPKSIVFHKYEFSRSSRMAYYMERNRYLALLQYYDWRTIVLFLPMIAFMEAGMAVYSLKNSWFDKRLEIYRYLLTGKTWAHVRESRLALSKIRRKSDKTIIAGFAGRIEFQEIANPLLDRVANPLMDAYFRLAKKIISW
jgi:GT2 family glycosyltransferase